MGIASLNPSYFASVLANDPRVERYEATVSHFESLHPHDAVARVSGVNA